MCTDKSLLNNMTNFKTVHKRKDRSTLYRIVENDTPGQGKLRPNRNEA